MIEMESLTCVGGREVNEDAVFVGEVGGSYLAVVADGLGGYGRGSDASGIAVDAMPRLVHGYVPDVDRARKAVLGVNSDILAAQHGGWHFKTTIAALWLSDREAVIAHVGDSRVYQFRNGRIVCQTLDHSVPQMAVMLGEITPAQIRGHEDRNCLTRCLGSSVAVKVDVQQVCVQAGDSFLLCSDGFWELITETEMERLRGEYTRAFAWLDAMCDLVKGRTDEKSDNQSAVVVQIEGDTEGCV